MTIVRAFDKATSSFMPVLVAVAITVFSNSDAYCDEIGFRKTQEDLDTVVVLNPELSLLQFSKTNDFTKLCYSPKFLSVDSKGGNELLCASLIRTGSGRRAKYCVYYTSDFYTANSKKHILHEIPCQCSDLYIRGNVDWRWVEQCNAVKRIVLEDFELADQSLLVALNAKFPFLESIVIDAELPLMEDFRCQDFQSAVLDLGLFAQFKALRSLRFDGRCPVANIASLSSLESLTNLEVTVRISSDRYRVENRDRRCELKLACSDSCARIINVRDIVDSVHGCDFQMEFVGVIPTGIETLHEVTSTWTLELEYRKYNDRQVK